MSLIEIFILIYKLTLKLNIKDLRKTTTLKTPLNQNVNHNPVSVIQKLKSSAHQ